MSTYNFSLGGADANSLKVGSGGGSGGASGGRMSAQQMFSVFNLVSIILASACLVIISIMVFANPDKIMLPSKPMEGTLMKAIYGIGTCLYGIGAIGAIAFARLSIVVKVLELAVILSLYGSITLLILAITIFYKR